MEIRIPAGTQDGTRMRISGKGNSGWLASGSSDYHENGETNGLSAGKDCASMRDLGTSFW